MRGLVVIGSLVVAGCGFNIDGGDPFTAEPTPDAPDARVDTDGDGFIDAVDVCPSVVDPDQRDHDGDERGDACDLCPHRSDDGADFDADGVGDLCDPRMEEAGDRIAYFEGFYAPVGWNAVIGPNTWTVASGVARQPSTTEAYQLIRDDNPDLTHVAIEARFQVHQITGDASGRRSTGIVTGYRDNDTYWFCGIAAAGTAAEVNAGKVTWGLFGNSYDFNFGGFPAQMPGDWAVLRARTSQLAAGQTMIDCEIDRNGLNGRASFTTSAAASGDIGLRTNGAAASFDYVFVVETP